MVIEVVGRERGRQLTNWGANDLSLEKRHNIEGAYLDPNTMPPGMTRWAPTTNAYAAATFGW